MAKIELDVMFREHSGHLDNIVFYTMWGKTYARRYVIPHNPKSFEQQANRSLFAEAMSEWKLLAEDVKQQYRKKTRRMRMHAHNLFVKEYMNAHKPDRTAECINKSKALFNNAASEYEQLHTRSVASPYGLHIKELSDTIQPAYSLNIPPF